MKVILILICALVFNSAGAFTQKQGKVMNKASGTFEVKLSPCIHSYEFEYTLGEP